MNRRHFLKLVPKMAGVSALGLAAPAVLSDGLPAQQPHPQMHPPKQEALPPEDISVMEFEKVANEIVEAVNGRMRAMSEDEMRERAGCSLKAYLEKYG